MKKLYLILSVLFTVLTLIGAGYVSLRHGTVSAGYACIPMVITLAFISLYRKQQ